jgi:hypothetical protein
MKAPPTDKRSSQVNVEDVSGLLSEKDPTAVCEGLKALLRMAQKGTHPAPSHSPVFAPDSDGTVEKSHAGIVRSGVLRMVVALIDADDPVVAERALITVGSLASVGAPGLRAAVRTPLTRDRRQRVCDTCCCAPRRRRRLCDTSVPATAWPRRLAWRWPS